MRSLLVAAVTPADTDFKARSKCFESEGTAQGDIAMNTLFDDLAATLFTAAFAIACATGMIAMLATSVATMA